MFIVLLTTDYIKCLQQLMVLYSRAASGRRTSFICNSCTRTAEASEEDTLCYCLLFFFHCSHVLLNNHTKYKHLASFSKFQPLPATKVIYPQFISYHATLQLFRSCLPCRAAHRRRGVQKAASYP